MLHIGIMRNQLILFYSKWVIVLAKARNDDNNNDIDTVDSCRLAVASSHLCLLCQIEHVSICICYNVHNVQLKMPIRK